MIRSQVPLVFRRRKDFPPFTMHGTEGEEFSPSRAMRACGVATRGSAQALYDGNSTRTHLPKVNIARPSKQWAALLISSFANGTAHVRRGQGGARCRLDAACPAHRCRFQSAEADGFGFAELPMLPKPVSRIL